MPKLMPDYFNEIAAEILFKIFTYLSPEQASIVAAVSKKSKKIIYKKLFWQEKYEKHFPHYYDALANIENINWRTEFRETYEAEYENLPAKLRRIFSFVKEGDLESLKAKGIKLKYLDQRDESDVSLLQWAQKQKNNQPLLNYFYEVAEENYKESGGIILDVEKFDDISLRTILHWAILCHQPKCKVERLISKGAGVDVAAPLLDAAVEGQVESAELLIANKANIDAISQSGATALLFATEHGHKNVVDVLLVHKANKSLALQYTTPYHKSFNAVEGDTPLHVAAKLGHKEIAEALLNNDQEVDTLALSNRTPLIDAATEGKAEIAKLLIDHKADINARTHCGATALLFATQNGHKDVVKVLLENKADKTLALQTATPYHAALKTNIGDTPLHVAAKLGNKEIAEALLNNGQPADTSALSSKTPLMDAAAEGQAEIVKLLIEHKANVNAQSGAGATALLFATENGHKDVVKVLLENKADTSLTLQIVSPYHASFNAAAGDTALHLAANLDHKEITQKLIKNNADTTLDNNYQQTPLDVATGYSKNLLKLEKYQSIRPTEADYKKSFTIFGHTFLSQSFTILGHKFNISKQEKLAAATALHKVYIEDADPSILNEHSDALNNGELGSIYNRLKKAR